MHNYNLLKKIIVCTLILVFSSSSFIGIVGASEGKPIGKPEGTAITTGKYFVTNLKVQTIYTLLGEKCVARLTWDNPKNLPEPLPYEDHLLFTYEGPVIISGGSVAKILKPNVKTTDINDLTCGKQYTFSMDNDEYTGDATVTVTLAQPGSATPEKYIISFNKITTTKTGNNCTATISWNRPKDQFTNTRITYSLYVFPKDKTSLSYTSPSLANTVSMQKTGALTCGKDYSAQVVISLDGAVQHRIDQGFMMPTVDGANKDATKTAADPSVIKGEQDKAEKTEIENQNGEGGDGECVKTCNKPNIFQTFNVTEQIRYVICQMQCTVISWISGALAEVFKTLVLPNLL